MDAHRKVSVAHPARAVTVSDIIDYRHQKNLPSYIMFEKGAFLGCQDTLPF